MKRAHMQIICNHEKTHKGVNVYTFKNLLGLQQLYYGVGDPG